MKEILITSSVLIAVILLVRWLFRGKVSQRLIYAAWLLVALRLLIPIQFGQSAYSVTTLTDRIENQSESIQQVQDAMDQPISGPTREELYEQLLNEYIQHSTEPVTPEVQEQIKAEVAEQVTAPTLAQVLTWIWIGGMAVMALWFLTANIRFLRRAKQGAEVFPCAAPVPVWLSANVSSPCLVGLFRPVIYLTPASIQSPQSMNHILTHEISHLRHWDHIWALVRCLCLCVYWFDPLVWAAAFLSKRDCELACDERALKQLGDSERIAYGKTLLATVTQTKSPTHLIETATAMNETKKQLKERVNYIVKKPRNLLIAVISLLLVAAIAAGCTFTGSKKTKPEATDPTVTDPTVTDPTVTDPTSPPPPPVTPAPIVTPPSPPSAAEQAALDTAEALIADYRLYNAVGVVCDYELVVQDMSQHLTATQKEAYWDQQYRIKCCDTAADVHAHIDSCLASSLLRRGYPDDILFTDGSDLYLIIVPTEMYGYTNVGVGQYSDSRIMASAGRFDEDGIYQTDIFTIEKTNGQFRITGIKKLEASPDAADPDTVGLTMELAEKLLGMTYCEFLYASNQIVLEHLNASELDETVKQQARDTITWDAPAIRSRALYLNDRGTLMLYFRYGSLLADTDPLYGFYCTEFDLQKYGWKPPADLKDVSYRWLFEMDDHVDGFTATGHDYLMLDSFFQEPDLFLEILAEHDTEAIRVLTLRMHSAIGSQGEYDLYTQLLLAISARTDLTDAEEQALKLLAEEIPEDFPYGTAPEFPAPAP